jgi:transcriptional regulator with XRE-family HTH domain
MKTSRAVTSKTPRSTERNPVALRIGTRLRQARHRAGLTQQALAGERYTKAYVSALENALVRPSMAALDYLAVRLGTTASQLMADQEPRWTRLEADLHLASGNWQPAADAYHALLETALPSDRSARAELLLGQAEALARMDRGSEAAASAAESVELFEALGRETDAALAGYWLSAAQFYQDNVTEAKAILQAILGKVRAGLKVEPDFKLRLLMALASNEAREGNNEQGLAYLEEVRALAGSLDDRRRAGYLLDLAIGYSQTGDFEGALRAGYASLALFTAADTPIEVAKLENELALAHLRNGNAARAAELAASAHQRFDQLDDSRLLAHVLDTEAQVALARGDPTAALELAGRAREMADEAGNAAAATDALLTSARAHAALSADAEARASFEQAADLARGLKRPGPLRQVLTEWADFLAARGDHEAAFGLTREALATQSRR